MHDRESHGEGVRETESEEDQTPQPIGAHGREDEDSPEAVEPGAPLEPGPEDEPRGATDPLRQLIRLAWAMIVVLVVLAGVSLTGWVRLSNEVDKVACIQRAAADFSAIGGPGSSSYGTGLARLAIRTSLAKCER